MANETEKNIENTSQEEKAVEQTAITTEETKQTSVEETKDTSVDTLKSTIKDLKKEIDTMKKVDTVEKKNYIVGEPSKSELNIKFKSFLENLDVIKGVSTSIPDYFIPEIVPSTGRANVKQYCKFQGRVQSPVMWISRATTAPTLYWRGLTGAGTEATIASTPVQVNLDCASVKVKVYDYQMFNTAFNVLNFVNSETSLVFPKYESVQILTGTGSPFTGIYGDSDVPTHSLSNTGTFSALTLADLRAMKSKISPEFRTSELRWFTDMTEEEIMFGVADSQNRITDIENGITKLLGYEVVCLPEGILNGISTTGASSKHIVLANLSEAVEYAEMGMTVEKFRTGGGYSTYEFTNWEAFGVRQPKAACYAKLHA